MTALLSESEAREKIKDPKFFIERFFYIVDKQTIKVPFICNPLQSEYYDSRTKNDLILKARKEGFSSLIEAMWLHACLFFQNTRAVTLAHELDATKRHFDRVRFFLNTMGLKELSFHVDLEQDNQKQIKFPHTNSSYWIGTAGSKSFGRGDDITHLHLSEVAHYENQDVLTSALEACVPGAWTIMETTANGVGETFHRMWQESKDAHSGSPWRNHFFSWFDDAGNRTEVPNSVHLRLSGPEITMKSQYKLEDEQLYWYRLKKARMADPSKMPQEHPSNDQEAFLSSGRHCFNLHKLAEKKLRLSKSAYQGELDDDGKKIRFVDDSEGRLRIWKMPRMGRSYLVVGDVGEGVPEGDFSVCHIIDRSSWEQVGIWRGRVDPGLFGRIMCLIGKFYDNAVLVPELNNHGWATVEVIKTEQYPHLLNTRLIWKENETPKDGFPTNEKTRGLIITALRNAVDDDTVFINDANTINEMESFVQNEKTGKFEAQKNCWDDCVISLAIGVYCLKFLTVDETYNEDSKHFHGNPLLTQSMIEKGKAAVGHRL